MKTNKELKKRNAAIYWLYQQYPNDTTLEEIGGQFGLTRQRIHAIVKKEQEKQRKQIRKEKELI